MNEYTQEASEAYHLLKEVAPDEPFVTRVTEENTFSPTEAQSIINGATRENFGASEALKWYTINTVELIRHYHLFDPIRFDNNQRERLSELEKIANNLETQ